MNFKERINPTVTTKALMSSVPYLIINKQALTKMFHYVDKCSEEVGWMGTAYREGQQITIPDVYLFDQEVHATTTEITPEGLSDFAQELLEQPDGIEIWNNLKLWGHSHVNMGVTPSGQDDKQMETFKEGGHDWFIRLIANKKGELKVDLYDYEHGIIYLDIPWEAEETNEEVQLLMQIEHLQRQLDTLNNQIKVEMDAPIAEEMKVKVRKKTYTSGSHGANNSNWANRQSKPNGGTTPNAPTATGTNDKEDTVKKNTTTEKTDVGNATSFDYFTNDDEVRQDFSISELMRFAYATTLQELDEILNEYGWYDCFTWDDLERILRVSKKVFFQFGGDLHDTFRY